MKILLLEKMTSNELEYIVIRGHYVWADRARDKVRQGEQVRWDDVYG